MEVDISLMVLFITSVASAAQPPHIVIILADDLGWNDVSFHGSNQIPTPNIDALAYDGVILSDYYVQPICSPSRGALLTARYPIHLGLQNGVINSCRRYGLGLNETILPQYLKKLGYATYGLGKWHLGFYTENYIPSNRGFDYYFGMYAGTGDYWTHCYDTESYGPKGYGLDLHRNGELVKDKFGVYGTHMFTDEALNIIHNHNTSQPLFLYFAEQAVHVAQTRPLEAPYEYVKQFGGITDERRRTYAGMVSVLDESVGKVTKALHERGMLQNSIIVFSTDNGGPCQSPYIANNAPLRGEKTTLWEGGVRGAAFVWSPRLKGTPRISNQLMHITDWLPTLLNAAGYDMSQLKPLDGVDQWAALVGNLPSKRKEVLLNIDPIGWESAIRVGNFKLHWHGKNASANWFPLPGSSGPGKLSSVADSDVGKTLLSLNCTVSWGKPLVVACGEKPANASWNCNTNEAPCLYDVVNDPCEYNNIAHLRPDILRAALDRLKAYNSSMVPMKNKPVDPMGLPGNNGMWAYVPWVKETECLHHNGNCSSF